MMEIDRAIDICHVRSAIFRKAKPDLRYYKNHSVPFKTRIPIADQLAVDWEEYDPRDDDDSSLFMFND